MTFSEIVFYIVNLNIPKPLFVLLFILIALPIGQYTPGFVKLIIHKFSPQQVTTIYDNLIEPIQDAFKVAGTFILISLALLPMEEDYQLFFNFIKPFIDLGVISSVAWLVSRLFRQFVRIYGIELIQKLGRGVDEFLLVFETLANIVIGFFAVLVFANSLKINLIGLMASLGIGGLAVAFAAQKILEQLLSTIVLYLDRPFEPGDYIRLRDGKLGRVESIGLRSTKIRTAGNSTLLIVPNSNLVSMEIENVTRAKKVMVLLYLDFSRLLEERDRALIKQIIKDSTTSVFGIDPGSTKVAFNDKSKNKKNQAEKITQARITFFILGSSEDSLQLRKHLLELANDTISEQLKSVGIQFTLQEPTIYVESPVTL